MRRTAAFLALGLLWGGCQAGATGRLNPQLLAQADEAFLREQYTQAAGLYESFLQENPNDPAKVEIRLQAGKARAGAGQPDAALQQFDLALGAQPEPSVKWEIQFRKAVVLRLMGDPARAVSLFRLVAQSPASERARAVSSDELHWEYASALFRSGDFRAGQAELGKVSPKGPYERKLIPRLGLTGFTVQVGAYADRAAAEAEAAKVKGALKPVVFDKVLYLVTSGLFARYDEALLEADRLRRLGYREVLVLP